MKDYNVTVTIKNNLIYKKMIEIGIPNVAELSRQCGVAQGVLGDMLALTLTLYNSRGTIRPCWSSLALFFRCLPEDLLPVQHHGKALIKNKTSFEMDAKEVNMIGYNPSPTLLVATNQASDAIVKGMKCLNERQQFVLVKRLLEDCTLKEVGLMMGIQQERVRQIEAKAIRKMRHPGRKLREHLDAINEA